MQEAQEKSQTKNQVILYIIIQYTPQRYVSAAIYDDRRRVFEITSFNDNQHYSNLQSLLIQTNPHEQDDYFFINVIIKSDAKSQHKKIIDKLQNLQHKIAQAKPIHIDITLALTNLLAKDMIFYLKMMEDKKAMHALQKLLETLKLHEDETNIKKFQLQSFIFEKYMRLDQPAITALQIFPKDMQKKIITGTNTIFQILNKCKTQIGTRCLKRWMRQPLQDINQINQRLNKVAFFLKYPVIKNTIQNQLKKLPDLDNLYYVFYKVESGKKNNVQINDLTKIYRTVHTMKQLLKQLTQRTSTHQQIFAIIKQIQPNVKTLNTICKMIQQNIIMEGRDNQFHVRPQAQKQLNVISKQQQRINKQVKDHIKKIQKQLDCQIQTLPSSVYKYVLEADKKKSIDFVKQNYKYLTSKQNKITFTTQTLVSHCKDLINLEQQYKQKQKQILKKMYKVVAGYYPIMQSLSKTLRELDVITTFASVINTIVGSQTPWCRPHFKQALKGQKIHHPCIKQCIPNNIDLTHNKTIILTGPNMGGKSTYIRTIGLSTYLSHIGCYVPAKQFQTSIIDSIITRVGASDIQIKGISTFMSEMIQCKTMLDSASSRSLVLVDELGRGTSTSQGFGLAWAICQQLHKKIKPYCLFATHFHQMTRMQEQVPGVKNMHTSCKIIDGRLILEYKILDGKMQKSYGIQVAKMLNFPQKIIKDAQDYLQLYQATTSKLKEMEIEQNNQQLTKEQRKAIQLYNNMMAEINYIQNPEDVKKIKNQYQVKIKEVLGDIYNYSDDHEDDQ